MTLDLGPVLPLEMLCGLAKFVVVLDISGFLHFLYIRKRELRDML